MSPITCWLNTSKNPESIALWLTPVQPDPRITGNVFVNLPRKADSQALADILRAGFGKKSFQVLLDFTTIEPTKSGSLAVKMDIATLKSCLSVKDITEVKPDPIADQFFAELASEVGAALTVSDSEVY